MLNTVFPRAPGARGIGRLEGGDETGLNQALHEIIHLGEGIAVKLCYLIEPPEVIPVQSRFGTTVMGLDNGLVYSSMTPSCSIHSTSFSMAWQHAFKTR